MFRQLSAGGAFESCSPKIDIWLLQKLLKWTVGFELCCAEFFLGQVNVDIAAFASQ